jgi:hypothetical protein
MEKYIKPVLDVVEFDAEDVITVSPPEGQQVDPFAG